MRSHLKNVHPMVQRTLENALLFVDTTVKRVATSLEKIDAQNAYLATGGMLVKAHARTTARTTRALRQPVIVSSARPTSGDFSARRDARLIIRIVKYLLAIRPLASFVTPALTVTLGQHAKKYAMRIARNAIRTGVKMGRVVHVKLDFGAVLVNLAVMITVQCVFKNLDNVMYAPLDYLAYIVTRPVLKTVSPAMYPRGNVCSVNLGFGVTSAIILAS